MAVKQFGQAFSFLISIQRLASSVEVDTLNNRRNKLIALALFSGFLVFCALTNAPVVPITQASSTNLLGTFTGAPAEGTCAIIGCHSGALNLDSAQIQIKPERISPDDPSDRSYKVTVTLMSENGASSKTRWGFQMTALKDNGGGAGVFSPSDLKTKVPNQGGPTGDRPYIEQNIERDEDGAIIENGDGTLAGMPQGEWTFTWQPIDDYSGPVTFYVAGCVANGNNRVTGDRIYTNKQTFDLPVGLPLMPVITEVKLKGSKLFVTGMRFDSGAFIYLNDNKVKKTIRNGITMLTGKKISSAITIGENRVVVINGNNNRSNTQTFQVQE